MKLSTDGFYIINSRFFDFGSQKEMFNKKLEKLIGFSPKKNSEEINQKYLDLASSIQKLIEEIILKICEHGKKITNQNNLCLAGGVALNCVANGLIIESKIFKNVWIQPAAGDAGASLGCALYLSHNKYRYKKNYFDSMQNSFLGNDINNKNKVTINTILNNLPEKIDNKDIIKNRNLIIYSWGVKKDKKKVDCDIIFDLRKFQTKIDEDIDVHTISYKLVYKNL